MPNARIDGFDFTLFYDYDCHRDHFLPKLSDDGKIEWLEARMRMIFIRPLSLLFDRGSSVFEQLERPINGLPSTSTLVSVSTLMNGIEALGSFLTHRKSAKRQNFTAFMNKYMLEWCLLVPSPRHNNRKLPLAEILWKAYRNGLTHSFAITGAGVDVVNGSDKFKIDGDALQIDIWKFFPDFRSAVDRMFEDVRKDKKIRTSFLKRFSYVYACS